MDGLGFPRPEFFSKGSMTKDMINVLTATMKEKPAGSMPLSLPKKKESGLLRRLYRKELREAVERCCLIDLGMVGGGLTCSKRGLGLVQTKIDRFLANLIFSGPARYAPSCLCPEISMHCLGPNVLESNESLS